MASKTPGTTSSSKVELITVPCFLQSPPATHIQSFPSFLSALGLCCIWQWFLTIFNILKSLHLAPAASSSIFQHHASPWLHNSTSLAVNRLYLLSSTHVDRICPVNSWFLTLPAFKYKATPRHIRVTQSGTHTKTQRSYLPPEVTTKRQRPRRCRRLSCEICSIQSIHSGRTLNKSESIQFLKLLGKKRFSNSFLVSTRVFNCFHWKRKTSFSC